MVATAPFPRSERTRASALERVCVLIVNFNSGQWLGRCVRALKGQGNRLPRIRVLDNGSTDASASDLPDMPGLSVSHAGTNLGFGPGINRLAQEADEDYLLILNPDCLLVADALERLITELDDWPQAAMVSGRMAAIRAGELFSQSR